MDAKRVSERGHLMVGLMAAVAILIIMSLVAEQLWADVLRRDLEAEMIFRAQDIVRALKRYRQDHGNKLPTELKELMEPSPVGGRYVLRKLWKDPLVKDGKWGLLYATPQGGFIDPNAPPGTDPTVPIGGTAPGTQRQQEAAQQPRSGGSRFGEATSEQQEPSERSGDSTGLKSRFGQGQQELTGLPIIGVKSLCTKKPFRILNDQTEYAMWRFTVLDLDQAAQVPTGPGGGTAPQLGKRIPGPRSGGSPSWGGKDRSGRFGD